MVRPVLTSLAINVFPARIALTLQIIRKVFVWRAVGSLDLAVVARVAIGAIAVESTVAAVDGAGAAGAARRTIACS